MRKNIKYIKNGLALCIFGALMVVGQWPTSTLMGK